MRGGGAGTLCHTVIHVPRLYDCMTRPSPDPARTPGPSVGLIPASSSRPGRRHRESEDSQSVPGVSMGVNGQTSPELVHDKGPATISGNWPFDDWSAYLSAYLPASHSILGTNPLLAHLLHRSSWSSLTRFPQQAHGGLIRAGLAGGLPNGLRWPRT